MTSSRAQRRQLTVPELELRYDGPSFGDRTARLRETLTEVDFLEVYDSPKSAPSDGDEPGGGVARVVYKEGLGHEEIVDWLDPEVSPEQENPDAIERTSRVAHCPKLRILFVRGVLLQEVHTNESGSLHSGPLHQSKAMFHMPPSDDPKPERKARRFNDIRPAVHSSTADFLTERLGVSPAFWAVLLWKTWVLKTGNCVFRKKGMRTDGEEEDVVEGWYRYSCGIDGFPSHVWFSYPQNTTTYIVNNTAFNGVQAAIVRCAKEGMADALLRPLAVDAFIAETTSKAWGDEVLLPRMRLVQFEDLDGNESCWNNPSESLRALHVLSYTLLIIKEDMTDHVTRLEYLIGLHETLRTAFLPRSAARRLRTKPQPLNDGRRYQRYTVSADQTLAFLLSEIRIRRRWVQSYADRTSIQINLYYSLSAQRDNKTNLQIADFTSRIATETQKDSSSMITMATMTMLFLPGMFVSAIFSMVFFDASSPSGLSISPSAWLFPAITIPLTILVFVVWNAWMVRRNQERDRQLNHKRGGDSEFGAGDPTNTSPSPSTFTDPQLQALRERHLLRQAPPDLAHIPSSPPEKYPTKSDLSQSWILPVHHPPA